VSGTEPGKEPVTIAVSDAAIRISLPWLLVLKGDDLMSRVLADAQKNRRLVDAGLDVLSSEPSLTNHLLLPGDIPYLVNDKDHMNHYLFALKTDDSRKM